MKPENDHNERTSQATVSCTGCMGTSFSCTEVCFCFFLPFPHCCSSFLLILKLFWRIYSLFPSVVVLCSPFLCMFSRYKSIPASLCSSFRLSLVLLVLYSLEPCASSCLRLPWFCFPDVFLLTYVSSLPPFSRVLWLPAMTFQDGKASMKRPLTQAPNSIRQKGKVM